MDAATRARPRRLFLLTRDPANRHAFAVLSVYLVLLFGIPSDLVVEPLGAAGTPAQLLGLVMIVWWTASKLTFSGHPRPSGPVAWLLLAFVAAMLSSYVVGMSRSIFSPLEINSADRALLSLFSWCGVILVIADGLHTRARLEQLLKLLACGVVFVAVLGCLQFFFGVDLARYLKVPGLTVNGSFGEIIDRSGYRRVSGTAAHPIEFGVVLAAGLPLLTHFARFSADRAESRRWWVAVLIVSATLPLSVARSAMVGLVIVAVVLVPSWPRGLRYRALLTAVVGLVSMSVVLPGLLGTIRGLFLNVGSDPSTQGRTADYGPVLHYVGSSPLSGRGLGTFIPSLYRTLDNQYLGLLVETGILGTLAFVVLIVGSLMVAGRTRRAVGTDSARDLALCLSAGIVVVAVDAATFDAFGFAMCMGTLAVLLGAVASLASIGRRSSTPPGMRGVVPLRRLPSQLGSSGALTVAVFLSLALVTATYALGNRAPEFAVADEVLLTPPQPPDQTAFARSGNATVAASILHDVLSSRGVRARVLGGTDATYEVAIGDSSIMAGTDDIGSGPILHLAVTAPTASGSVEVRRALATEARDQLARIQGDAGVPVSEMITLREGARSEVHPVRGSNSRGDAGEVMLLMLVVLTMPGLLRGAGRDEPSPPRPPRTRSPALASR